MSTEGVNPRYVDLDLWSTVEGLKALHEEQTAAVASVGPALPAIAAAVDAAATRLSNGGRLIYVGAGTSARIGVQDGAELFPTFNWPREQVAFVIAGGEGALLRAIENAEDSSDDGARRMEEIAVRPDDVAVGIAASGGTPFTVAAIKLARERGALTIGVANNRGSPLLQVSEHPILIETGAEPVAGSTRLKAGTAQKVVLNLFSTMVMIRLGRVYRGLMVHMQPTNEKLRRRAAQMIVTLTGCSVEDAATAMTKAEGEVKLAILIARGIEKGAARMRLEEAHGNLRQALAASGLG